MDRLKDLNLSDNLPEGLELVRDEKGLALVSEDQVMRGDYTKMINRVKQHAINKELLAKVAKIKGEEDLVAVDATAGLGEDSLLLAAAGFKVIMFERNPVIYQLLCDTIQRAAEIPELTDIVACMYPHNMDSMEAMKIMAEGDADTIAQVFGGLLSKMPDVILLDPMFPERQKSALVKKKLQMIQKLEIPCTDEMELLKTAMEVKPKKLVIKRPPKGPYLAGIKPDHSLQGKAVRFDCFVNPYDRIHKFEWD
ncbi:MAG: class I SAM-dependent methyltransferase [Firmicutes bacterium]|nr:class I SAM-dependent methyltransferase [Bacillota bacterium]